MKYIKAFFLFWYDFLVGDDWKIAASVVFTLAIAWVFAHQVSDTWAAAVLVLGLLLTVGAALRRSVQETA